MSMKAWGAAYRIITNLIVVIEAENRRIAEDVMRVHLRVICESFMRDRKGG
jgi:hypothetical protein